MKKNIPTPLADDYLQTVQPISEAETAPFFYARLKSKMGKRFREQEWSFRLKPVWLVTMLVLFLFINTFFLVTQVKQSGSRSSEGTSLQNFAYGYDLSDSNSF